MTTDAASEFEVGEGSNSAETSSVVDAIEEDDGRGEERMVDSAPSSSATGFTYWKEKLGSAKHVVAPMVDQRSVGPLFLDRRRDEWAFLASWRGE